jgi:hypothetical protein
VSYHRAGIAGLGDAESDAVSAAKLRFQSSYQTWRAQFYVAGQAAGIGASLDGMLKNTDKRMLQIAEGDTSVSPAAFKTQLSNMSAVLNDPPTMSFLQECLASLDAFVQAASRTAGAATASVVKSFASGVAENLGLGKESGGTVLVAGGAVALLIGVLWLRRK